MPRHKSLAVRRPTPSSSGAVSGAVTGAGTSINSESDFPHAAHERTELALGRDSSNVDITTATGEGIQRCRQGHERGIGEVGSLSGVRTLVNEEGNTRNRWSQDDINDDGNDMEEQREETSREIVCRRETKRERMARLAEERRLRKERVEAEMFEFDSRWVFLGGKEQGCVEKEFRTAKENEENKKNVVAEGIVGKVRLGDSDDSESVRWVNDTTQVEIRHFCRWKKIAEGGEIIGKGSASRIIDDRLRVLGVRKSGMNESVQVMVGYGVALAMRGLVDRDVLCGWIKRDYLGLWLVLGLREDLGTTWSTLDEEGRGCLKVLLRWSEGQGSMDKNIKIGLGVWSGEWLALGKGWLYEAMRRRTTDEDCEEWKHWVPIVDSGLGELRVQLRPYQKRAVAWMLCKERGAGRIYDTERERKGEVEMVINEITGAVNEEGMSCSGGLLADEMGLGKTVEVLALIELGRLELSNLASISDVTSDTLGSSSNSLCSSRASLAPSDEYGGVCFICKHAGVPDSDSGNATTTSQRLFEECIECSRRVHLECARLELCVGRREYLCPDCYHCYVKNEPRPSNATLIVVPGTLLDQWQYEIARHAPHLSLCVFDGVRDSGFISSVKLASADVVLTTYDSLKNDVHRTEALNTARKMRRKKKYPVVPTPLLHVNWHRVCLDEAQMVENSVSTQAQMALKLTCKYRWCVTGTPAHTGVYDLQGIAQFLRWEPFLNSKTWVDILIDPARHGDPSDIERVRLAMRYIGWRTAKDDVADEIGLPPQVSEVIPVQFGPIESYYYKKLQDRLQALLSLSGREVNANPEGLMNIYLRLRQACSHPQVSRSMLPPLKRAKKVLRMTDVLDSLIAKAKVETEDAAREFISASNGLCGTMLLEGGPENLSKAVSLYRESLQLAHDNKDLISIDKLQRLHILHNLADTFEMIDAQGPHPAFGSLGRTLADSSLRDDAKSIRENYAVSAQSRVVAATGDLKAVTEEIGKRDMATWMDEALALIQDDLKEVEKKKKREQGSSYVAQNVNCVERIQDSLHASSTLDNDHRRSFASRFVSLQALYFVVQNHLEALEADRQALLRAITKLPGAVGRKLEDSDVQTSGSCGTCRYGMSGPACQHCKVEASALRPYESKLFFISNKNNDENDRKRRDRRERRRAKRLRTVTSSKETGDTEDVHGGTDTAEDGEDIEEILAEISEGEEDGTAAATTSGAARIRSSVEQTVRIIVSMAKRVKVLKPRLGLLSKMDKWIAQTDATKKEYAQVLHVFRTQRDYLGSLDELSMSTLRLTFAAEGVELKDLSEHELLYMIPHGTLHIRNAQFTLSRRQAMSDFRQQRGHLMYLRALEERQASSDKAPERCVVCWNDVTKMALFTCGHTVCYRCSRSLVRARHSPSKKSRTVKCPTCRSRIEVDEIVVVVHDSEAQRAAEKEKEAEEERSWKERSAALEDMKKIEVIGSHSSKVTAIISKIKEVGLSDPEAKSVVFSEWYEALEVLSNALRENGIENILIGTGRRNIVKALNHFRDKGNVTSRVLLLPIKRAGAGLNLTEATHVFLMEPRLNTAIDDQAVSRVHRIGQKKKTFVWKFVVKGTVEEKVLQLARKKAGKVSVEDTDTCNDVFELFKDHHRVQADEERSRNDGDDYNSMDDIDDRDIVDISVLS